jgi:hypothetical protein
MLSDKDTRYLTQLTRAVTDAETQLQTAKDVRDEAIRLALESGGGPTELAKITGLTRERIYQIKERRR